MPEPSAPAPAAAPAKKRSRGRESVSDMVRSLGLVMLIVVPVWYLAQPPDSDEQAVRVVDTAPDIAVLLDAAPGVPVPRDLPPGFRPTSSTLEPQDYRIGMVTPSDEYAEYAASTRPEFVTEITGGAPEVGNVPAGGQTWRLHDDGEDRTTLVREAGGRTVAIGGVRETTTLDELLVLAEATR